MHFFVGGGVEYGVNHEVFNEMGGHQFVVLSFSKTIFKYVY